ncbi:MAG: AAA family ATPase [Leptospiraceae bacterium]|nr:AAA family ATPase [Leptospiraceae bacterium]MCP5513370.1 AAA family ATPase [Leptospiraceae bacterium]
MAIYYYNQLVDDPEKAIELKEKTYTALQPFYQYLNKTKKAIENRTVSASWEKVGGIKIRLTPKDSFYQITPISQIKYIQTKNWFLVISDQDLEEDFSSPLKIKETKSNVEIKPHNLKKEKNYSYIELPDEYSEYEKLNIIWGFGNYQLEKVGTNNLSIKEVRQKGKSYQFKVDGSRLSIFGIFDENELLEIDGKRVRYEVEDSFDLKKLNGKNYFKFNESWILISEDEIPLDRTNVRIEKINFDFHWLRNISKFELATGKNIDLDCINVQKMYFLSIEECNFESLYSLDPKIHFEVNLQNMEEYEKFWIQLIEEENESSDDEIQSPLENFFDDEVEIEEIINNKPTRNKYFIFKGIEGERKIVLSNQNRKPVFPADNAKLRARRSTYQIGRQIQAIRNLQERPSVFHTNLINLFEGRDLVDWKATYYENIEIEWKILTDDEYSGVEKQRDFVNKALATQEFAIMEGPPGSGKTTVILEIIFQLLKQGKRVLLCGSTHVAIDNILERIQEKELLDTIFPIRIGDKNRISEQIKQFSIEELNQKYANIGEKLLLESSNLVCGTTIGILQYPRIKEIKPNDSIIPEFDYLIIDESSKTTFQEFLVPALFAKKWIIVGDVKQLSPFTEPLQITTNLNYMDLNNNRQLSLSLQKICLLLYKLYPYENCKFIIPLNRNEMIELIRELEMRLDQFEKINILLINDHLSNNKQNYFIVLHSDEFKKKAIQYINFNLIFIDESLVEKLIQFLPETMSFLLYEPWKSSIHAFKHNIKHNKSISFKTERDVLNDSFQINDSMINFFKEKSWATEVGWRLNRTYEKRLARRKQGKSDPLQDQVEKMLPKSIDIKQQIETIRCIAFPSVLEGLVKGIKDRYVKSLTTLTSGFKKVDLDNRHTILDYQHRMHPDISVYPRERFYSEKDDKGNTIRALLDSKNIKDKRDWEYLIYNNRRVWIDIRDNVFKNTNKKEVERLIDELKKFVEWAKAVNPPHDQKNWEVGVLTFYRGQEKKIKEELRSYCNLKKNESRFHKDNIIIKLHTVDKFQGQEADIVFLSMVQNKRDGFMDSPNRLNVAITRARYQLVIIGDYDYFSQKGDKKTRSEDLAELAKNTIRMD